jgi:hypothetical protein
MLKQLSNINLRMADCFTPCLITGFVVFLAFLIAHIFLYLKLLELSRKRDKYTK